MDYKELYIDRMKKYFGKDKKRIDHSLSVLKYALAIASGEGTDDDTQKIVVISAIFHDIGIKNAEIKYNSSAARYQEIEGPPVARKMMEENNEDKNMIERVCYIIGHHHTMSAIDGLDFRIIWEADMIVNIEGEGYVKYGEDYLKKLIEKNFATNSGKKIVKDLYLK